MCKPSKFKPYKERIRNEGEKDRLQFRLQLKDADKNLSMRYIDLMVTVE
jgi:hypothetical protein